jgi:beta-glucanase (GH16 family)
MPAVAVIDANHRADRVDGETHAHSAPQAGGAADRYVHMVAIDSENLVDGLAPERDLAPHAAGNDLSARSSHRLDRSPWRAPALSGVLTMALVLLVADQVLLLAISAVLAVALWRARTPEHRIITVVLLVAVLAAAADASLPAGSSVARQPPTDGGYTRLVWSDEFGGRAGAPPSSSAWVHDVGAYGWPNHELETYTDSTANAARDGRGHLAIVARRETATAPDGRTRDYTSARLTTRGRFSATHGLFAARMKIPAGRGLWPAFWMLGDDINAVGWPASGEIDVMEALGHDPRTVHGTLHGPGSGAAGALGSSFVAPGSLASGFHTYAVSWSPDSVAWLLDGKAYATAGPEIRRRGWSSIFNRPFHLLLNLAVGGTWPGPPDASTPLPATLLVDWVRVYR